LARGAEEHISNGSLAPEFSLSPATKGNTLILVDFFFEFECLVGVEGLEVLI
jgi:hypothetical protein